MTVEFDDKYLPATLTAQPMTDEEFVEFCNQYPDLFFEATAEGDIIMMAPAYTAHGAANSSIVAQLHEWHDRGDGVVVGSNTGFVLPNGADAAWISCTAIDRLAIREGYWRLCPEFVIELKCESDNPRLLREKMADWMENGAVLAWLIDPKTRTVRVYRQGREPEVLAGVSSMAGEGPVAGFVLDLSRVWKTASLLSNS